jgi:hypothetical protein
MKVYDGKIEEEDYIIVDEIESIPVEDLITYTCEIDDTLFGISLKFNVK